MVVLYGAWYALKEIVLELYMTCATIKPSAILYKHMYDVLASCRGMILVACVVITWQLVVQSTMARSVVRVSRSVRAPCGI